MWRHAASENWRGKGREWSLVLKAIEKQDREMTIRSAFAILGDSHLSHLSRWRLTFDTHLVGMIFFYRLGFSCKKRQGVLPGRVSWELFLCLNVSLSPGSCKMPLAASCAFLLCAHSHAFSCSWSLLPTPQQHEPLREGGDHSTALTSVLQILHSPVAVHGFLFQIWTTPRTAPIPQPITSCPYF